MSYSKHSGSSALPRTYIGRWLRAAMLDQREERDRLVSTLNGGSSTGWNYDEPAVVDDAMDLVLRRYFGPGDPDPAALAELMELITAALMADKRPLDVPRAEAVIHSWLGNDTEDADEVNRLRLRALVVSLVSGIMELVDTDVDALLREAERVTFERGFHPMLVPRGRPAAERRD